MSERGTYTDAVRHMAGEIIEGITKQDLARAVVISALIVPFYYLAERPALSLSTIALLLFLWVYAAMGLCVFMWVFEELLDQYDTDGPTDSD